MQGQGIHSAIARRFFLGAILSGASFSWAVPTQAQESLRERSAVRVASAPTAAAQPSLRAPVSKIIAVPALSQTASLVRATTTGPTVPAQNVNTGAAAINWASTAKPASQPLSASQPLRSNPNVGYLTPLPACGILPPTEWDWTVRVQGIPCQCGASQGPLVAVTRPPGCRP
jgi:hypothetical protein